MARRYQRISADCHLDMLWLPPDLFKSNASSKLKDLKQQTVDRFKRMLPPEKAGEAIVRAIERNTARLLITPEAYVIDAVKRVFPALSTELVGWRWQKLH